MTDQALRVLINGGGGRARREGAALGQTLSAAFAETGIRPSIETLDGKALAEAVHRAKGASVVAVGGGDGTMGSAAGILAGGPSALAVLPLGTLNHFAAEIGLGSDLLLAAQTAVSGKAVDVDLGAVGDTVFLNNASVGIYSRMVKVRDSSRLPKWLATIPAALHVLRHFRLRPMQLTIDGASRRLATPLLFVGNNRYQLTGRSMGQRLSLSDGILSIYAVRSRSPIGLIAFGLRAIIGRADPQTDFEAIGDARMITIEGSGSIDVAHDGEVTRMALPLTFTVRPGALKVMVPPAKV